MIISALDIGIAIALLSAAASFSGYLAGCAAYYISRNVKPWSKLHINTQLALCAYLFSIVYVTFLVLLPFLLLSAHWAWWRLTTRRLRREKIAIAVHTIAMLREHPAQNQPAGLVN